MEVMGIPFSDLLLGTLTVIVLGQVVWITMLLRGLRKVKRNCEWATGLISRLADENNWGEIIIMSSRNTEPTAYKTWTGEGNPQDLAKRASG